MKTLFKKSFAVFLSAVLLLSVLPFTASAAEVVASGTTGDCTWTLDSDGVLTISGNGAMEDYFYVNPWQSYYFGLTSVIIEDGVTRIGNYAFLTCDKISSVVIPNSVTSIGKYAFSDCRSLRSIVIPNSVSAIDEWTFAYCENLVGVMIPGSVTSISDDAFYGCSHLNIIGTEGTYAESYAQAHNIPFVADSEIHTTGECIWMLDSDGTLTIMGSGAMEDYSWNSPWCYQNVTSVIIKDGVTRIGHFAFNNCDQITSVTISDSVESIGDYAFCSCYALTDVVLPDSVLAVGDFAFASCCGLQHVTLSNSLTKISDYAFAGTNRITTITIPDSVVSIDDGAFSGCAELTAITLPNSVVSIGREAFEFCSALESIHIPQSVTNIQDDVFLCCTSLASITVDPNNPVYDSRNNCNAIIQTDNHQLVAGCSTTVIPDTVISIGKRAFFDAELTAIDIPGSVSSIGERAFESCGRLTTVRFSEGLTDIGEEAFWFCSSLKHIAIPGSVTTIGADAFTSCYGVTSITVDPNNPVYDSRNNCNAIIETAGNKLIVGCRNTIIPNSVTSIGASAFENCGGLEKIEIPNSVTSIGASAFEDCDGLKTIMLPNSVTTIGKEVFQWCSGLTGVFIPESVTAIGKDAFYQCNNLTIYGIAGSYAETYANQNNIPFVSACPSCETPIAGNTVEIVPPVAATYTQTGATQGLRCTHCGEWIIEPEVLETKPIDFTIGDISGDGVLTIDDATLLQQVLAEFIELDLEDEITFLQADTNGDGHVNVKDVTFIQRKVAELI